MTIKLIILLHGVGSSAHDMTPFARALSDASGIEAIALDGPEGFDMAPTGRQWFSVKGVTEGNRPGRVAMALPPLLDRIDALLTERGLDRNALVLAGFSQGAIMTLAAMASGETLGGAIAIAGRMTLDPVAPGAGSPSVLLLHDHDDPIMPFRLAEEAQMLLGRSGHDVRLIATNHYGHSIGSATLDAACAFLSDVGVGG